MTGLGEGGEAVYFYDLLKSPITISDSVFDSNSAASFDGVLHAKRSSIII